MADETPKEGTDTPTVGAGDVVEGKPVDVQKSTEEGQPGEEGAEGVQVGEAGVSGDEGNADVTNEGEGTESGEPGAAGTEEVDGEHVEGEGLEGEHIEGEHVEGEATEGEHVAGEHVEGEEKILGEGEELEGEGLEGEQVEGEEAKTEEDLLPPPPEEVEEEEVYVEEPPPDPAAPYDFSDSKEAMKAPFELRPDQLAEVEQLWELYQNCTPAYSDLDGFVTEKELVYMLKCLFLMTYTVEQLQELIEYCCRPPNAKGYIFYDQFLKMVTIRQRDFPIEEEIRSALQVFDPEKTGIVEREELKEVLLKQGHKMPAKQLDNLVKEVDMSNDGQINIEDVVATMCLDLNKEDLQMLRQAVYPPDPDEAFDTVEEGRHVIQEVQQKEVDLDD